MLIAALAQPGALLANVTALVGAGRALQASTVSVCPDVRLATLTLLSARYHHACIIFYRGWNLYGQTDVPSAALSGQVSVGTGDAHTCSLSTAGAVRCWGCGQGSWCVASTLSVPASNEASISLSVGAIHSCVLSETGRPSCWGNNAHGEIDIPTSATFNQVAVSAGAWHNCALSNVGAVIAGEETQMVRRTSLYLPPQISSLWSSALITLAPCHQMATSIAGEQISTGRQMCLPLYQNHYSCAGQPALMCRFSRRNYDMLGQK